VCGNPFHVVDFRLHSLASGKAAWQTDCISLDMAEGSYFYYHGKDG